MMCGGTGNAMEADEEVKSICEQVRGELEEKLNKQVSELTPISYKSQLVAGTNFFIKAHIGNQEYIHFRVYRPLPGQGSPSVHSCQQEKSIEDEIEYFE